MNKEKNKVGWVIFGPTSGIAKELIALLKQSNEKYFEVGRDQNIAFEALQGLELNIVMFNGKVFFKKFTDITEDDLHTSLNSNFISTVTFLQKLYSNNLNLKKVLLVGTRAGQLVGHHKYFSLYAATKMACLGLFRSLSAEYPQTLFTYYICPATETNIFKNGIVDLDLMNEVKSKEISIKKTPAEIAKIIKNSLDNQIENYKDLLM